MSFLTVYSRWAYNWTVEETQKKRNQQQDALKRCRLKDNPNCIGGRRKEKEKEDGEYVLCDYSVLDVIGKEPLDLECAGYNKTFKAMCK